MAGARSEDELAGLAVQGDESALIELLDQVSVRLHAEIARDIGPRYRGLVDADDIVQVTFMEAFLRMRSFIYAGPGSFLTWLRRIAQNNLRDAIKELERDRRPPPGKRIREPVGEH